MAVNADEQVKKRNLHILLEQIKAPQDFVATYFQEALLDKLVIDTADRSWHFHICVPAPLPFEIYQWFKTRLQETFANIAPVSFSLQSDVQEISESLICDYWPLFIDELTNVSDSILSFLKGQKPKLDGSKLIISARNEAEAVVLKRKLSESLAGSFQICGLPVLTVETEVKQSEADYEKFLEQKENEDRTKMAEAVIQREKIQKKEEQNIPAGSLAIGYPIKDEPVQIQTITEEERKITIQGYVFEAETRELRSGRVLLQLKITDYSDSLFVKMFSRKDEDIPKLQAAKKGMWVKARGSIQHDTFVRDLVMIANDLEQIPGPERTDDAPEGEKRVELHLHTPMSQMDAVTSVSDLVKQAKKWGHKPLPLQTMEWHNLSLRHLVRERKMI